MRISRRDFLKYCVGSATALGLEASGISKLEKALFAGTAPRVIWLAASNCTGCTVSLANRIRQTINRVDTTGPLDLKELLVGTIDLAFHPNLMGAAGDQAVEAILTAEQLAGSGDKFILAVEGGVPTALNGKACFLWTENGKDVTAMEAVKRLSANAKAILSIGTCASFGGMSGASPNPTGIQSVKAVTGKSTVNIPGCPAHPDWIVGTIAHFMAGTLGNLDSYGRPVKYFPTGSTIHSRCERNERSWASTFGQEGLCLADRGCKGRNTRGDCPVRKWNSGTNWCVGANALCIGCTESGFPDKFSPFFSSVGSLPPGEHPRTNGQSCSSCHGPGGADDD